MSATTLHEAIENGDVKACEALLKAGADVHAVNEDGWTPLHKATVSDSLPCLSLLLQAGASVNATNNYGDTPLHLVALDGNGPCVSLLLQAGANVDAANKWNITALYRAAEAGSEACVSLLLQAGADVNATDEHGDTPLCIAIEKRNDPSVAVLAAVVARLEGHVPPGLLRVSEEDQAALADESDWCHGAAVEVEERRVVVIAVLQGESRWRRRRPLALIREQRRAVRDAGLVHKEWEKRAQEEQKAK